MCTCRISQYLRVWLEHSWFFLGQLLYVVSLVELISEIFSMKRSTVTEK